MIENIKPENIRNRGIDTYFKSLWYTLLSIYSTEYFLLTYICLTYISSKLKFLRRRNVSLFQNFFNNIKASYLLAWYWKIFINLNRVTSSTNMVTMVCGFPRYERIYKSSMSTYFFARLIDESLCPSQINSKDISYDILFSQRPKTRIVIIKLEIYKISIIARWVNWKW